MYTARLTLYAVLWTAVDKLLSRFAQFLMTVTAADLRPTRVVRRCYARRYQEVAGSRDKAWPRVHAGVRRRHRRRGMIHTYSHRYNIRPVPGTILTVCNIYLYVPLVPGTAVHVCAGSNEILDEYVQRSCFKKYVLSAALKF